MADAEHRVERDSLGEVHVPKDARYQAQTQRAVENFPYNASERMPLYFIHTLAHVKAACARANESLGLLPADISRAVQEAADAVAAGNHDAHFPLSVFQTGSGTSSNMNVNEVIASLASEALGRQVHPNDHVNMSQSSNDVVPTALNASAVRAVVDLLLPAMTSLELALSKKAEEVGDQVKTGRTHLMDAMPVTFGQELGAWHAQVRLGRERIESSLPRIRQLAIGATAVGTGINAHPDFGRRVREELSARLGVGPFGGKDSLFEGLSAQDAAAELSGQLKTVAVALTKIANDLRWMNSGPVAGIGEICLPALQPGSSIMPGKVNPVIPESVVMAAAQVIGNDTAITVGCQAGNFQLNVMLPLLARNLLQSVSLLATACQILGEKAIAGFTVNREHIESLLSRNPVLVTALNPVIGYELGAKVAKEAYATRRSVKEVALERTDLTEAQLDEILDPRKLTQGGICAKPQ